MRMRKTVKEAIAEGAAVCVMMLVFIMIACYSYTGLHIAMNSDNYPVVKSAPVALGEETSTLSSVGPAQSSFSIVWRDPATVRHPFDATELIVIRGLINRFQSLQVSPQANDRYAKVLYTLTVAEQQFLGEELRGDMPAFPGK